MAARQGAWFCFSCLKELPQVVVCTTTAQARGVVRSKPCSCGAAGGIEAANTPLWGCELCKVAATDRASHERTRGHEQVRATGLRACGAAAAARAPPQLTRARAPGRRRCSATCWTRSAWWGPATTALGDDEDHLPQAGDGDDDE
jgi:hypothetical protein